MILKSGKNRTNLSYAFLRVMWKLFETDRKTRFYGTDKRLFEAEIHMIKYVKENEGIHITGLAGMLGLTKGAVSQIIMKLQKKGMVIKSADPRNSSRLSLNLTSNGEIAYAEHEKLHQKFDRLVNRLLKDASGKDISFLMNFLNLLEHELDELQKGECD